MNGFPHSKLVFDALLISVHIMPCRICFLFTLILVWFGFAFHSAYKSASEVF